ncbi:MAG: AAA domain-containing protein [bacterium]|nr:AAA domain-containing protein [bacterium]
MNRRETVERAAEQWAKELTDESGRNRLLYYRVLNRGTLELDQANPGAKKRLLTGKSVQAKSLFPGELFDDALRRIRAVNRQATSNYEEKGINTLFLGWGMATWTPVSSRATPAAPVLLCPVDLERTGAAETDFDMKLSGDWTLNEALLQHLANEFKVDVSGEDLMDPYGDGEQISEEEERAIFANLSQRAERVPAFGIEERVVLGNFMYKKMPMVNDINENLGALAESDLIAAIAGDEEAGNSLRTHHASDVKPSLPDRPRPQNEYLVLDADSSQNAAINAAVAEGSFVLQGPPGTGKSQTISNLIATMMAEGKSVLFVAEKRAAIDAVNKRLTRVGLDRFVIDLHGGISSRKELARQFNQSITDISQNPPVDRQDLHRQLQEARDELTGHSEALHQEREPWGVSYFEVLTRLLSLKESESAGDNRPQPPIQFSPPALAELDEATALQVCRDLKDWADLSEPLRSGRSPWAGAQVVTSENVRTLQELLTRLLGYSPELLSPLSRGKGSRIWAWLSSSSYRTAGRTLKQLNGFLPTHRLAKQAPADLLLAAKMLLDDQVTLSSLPRLVEVEQRLRGAHAGPLIECVGDGTLSANLLEAAFNNSWLRSIQREMLLEDGRLSGFQGSRQSRYVREFQQGDTEHIQGNPARVARRIAEHAVTALNENPDQDQLIRKEAKKKTRHLPLRRMFEQAPEGLLALRPCWAMSPLDVAQTLPPRPLFDLVVFDEASQVLPCDAIPALLRGRRAMVAGDSRQLPPTTFFDGSGGDDDLDEDEESMSDYESILDVMDTRLSRRPLAWHYRSQDERLIAYSNQEIYHGSLTTFPGANSDKCLSWELVPHRRGVATEKGSNSDEVLRVVGLMIDHAHQRPAESLGVIAMGLHHANRIEEALRRRIEEENSSELEEFFKESHEERAFVKNLERVQGDERDAIILSIGYGKNADGKMQYRFGPLNQEGGERRLNVAITRARKRMTLVSSFDYADMDPERTRSTGAKMLRGFLKFAQSGGTELDGADEQTPLNPFELDILDKLGAAGLDVVPQYGCSGYRIDFAVRHPTVPGQFALAVEADGASYHSSPTARDRDRLRQEHLERLGWRFCRIWSANWFNDHRTEVERVLAAYKKAVAETDGGGMPPSVELSDEPRGNPDWGISAASTALLPPRLPKPRIPHYTSIDDYSHEELVSIAQWIESDELLRTQAQLFEEIFEELPFKRRGTKINAAINKAIQASGDNPRARDSNGTEPKREQLPTPDAASGSSTDGSASGLSRYTHEIVGIQLYQDRLRWLMRGGPRTKGGWQLREVGLILVAQPHNPHDSNAISIKYQGHVVGHIARTRTIDFHRTYGDRLIAGMEVDGLVVGRPDDWSVILDIKSIR